MSCGEQFMLPTIEFVGGSTQELAFRTYFRTKKRPYDLTDCEAYFSVIGYANRGGVPLFTKAMWMERPDTQDDETVPNILRVTLGPSDTVDLHGKYVYQITIKEAGNDVEIPKKGILIVEDNIDRGLIS